MTSQILYEGKAKIVYEGKADTVIMQFKNSLTAFNGVKKAELEGKGELNWKISTILMKFIQNLGIPTHFIQAIEENKHICQKVSIIPVEVVVRNQSAGTFCKRYGIDEGLEFSNPLVEFFYKKDHLNDPAFTPEIIIELNLATNYELELLKYYALIINHYLKDLFKKVDLKLIDFKLEFGKNVDGKIILADEITPDTMRLWRTDVKEDDLSQKILDKDRFRRDLGPVDFGYREILQRLNSLDISNIESLQLKQPLLRFQLHIELKKSISDSQGETTLLALKRAGYSFSDVRLGKIITLTTHNLIELNKIHSIIQSLLINPLIENYKINFLVGELEN